MINKIILLFLFYSGIAFSISFSSCNSSASKEHSSLFPEVSQETLEELAQLDAIKTTIDSNDKIQFDKDEIVV